MSKRAEMGVGTLIIFIAMLLVAAVAAGVLIQTVGSLQEKGLSTGQQAKGQIATNLKVVEISATDGRTRTLTDFAQIVKLSPGSDPIKLDQMIFTFNTYTKTATLAYRGTNGTLLNDNTGYSTWVEQEAGLMRKYNVSNPGAINFAWTTSDFDFDGDGVKDNVTVCRNGPGICNVAYNDFYLAFNISSVDTLTYVPLYDSDGSTPADVSSSPQPLGNVRTPVGTYGFINTRGSTGGAWTLSAGQLVSYINETELDVDFDDDSANDYLVVNDTHAIFQLSTDGEVAVSLGMDLRTPGAISVDTTIESGSTRYASLIISGTTETADQIPANVTFEITPINYGHGYFVAEYLEEGSNFVEGNIQRGDVVRLFYESPEPVGEDEEIRINMIPKIGIPTLSKFATPSVISTERVYLYP